MAGCRQRMKKSSSQKFDRSQRGSDTLFLVWSVWRTRKMLFSGWRGKPLQSVLEKMTKVVDLERWMLSREFGERMWRQRDLQCFGKREFWRVVACLALRVPRVEISFEPSGFCCTLTKLLMHTTKNQKHNLASHQLQQPQNGARVDLLRVPG